LIHFLCRYSVVDSKAKKPREEEAAHAKHCLKTLAKTCATLPRKCPPSCEEIMFVTVSGLSLFFFQYQFSRSSITREFY